VAAALVVAGLAAGAAGCGDDEEDEAVRSVQEAVSTAQERVKSVGTEAEERVESVQEQLDEELQDNGGGGGGY
jgi:ribosomal protein S5